MMSRFLKNETIWQAMEIKKYTFSILIMLLITVSGFGQILFKPKIELSRLPSNGISDIVVDGDNI